MTSAGSAPAPLASAGGTVYLSSGLQDVHNLTALGLRDGKPRWAIDLRDEYSRGFTGPGAVSEGPVFASVGSILYAADAASGTVRWKQQAKEMIDGKSRPASLSEFTIHEGTIYAGTSTGIQGWEASAGKAAFSFPAIRRQGSSQTGVEMAGGVLYFHGNSELPLEEGKGSGWLYAVDPRTKQLLWKYHAARPHAYDKTGSWPKNYMLPADGALFYETEKRLVKLIP